jgi:imidazole glycerol-phosphate synthase subunit HisH
MKVTVINYEAGNIQSVLYALQRLGVTATVTDEAALLQQADKVIFPGVGHAGAAMQSLRQKGLDAVIPMLRQPVLGICVGMQLLCRHSEEDDTTGLGIIDAAVKKFVSPPGKSLKVPQMGWNTIEALRGPLFEGIPNDTYIYYVHSYYVETGAHTAAVTQYGVPYSAAVQQGNFYGVQFHTEKSAAMGERILQNFLNL